MILKVHLSTTIKILLIWSLIFIGYLLFFGNDAKAISGTGYFSGQYTCSTDNAFNVRTCDPFDFISISQNDVIGPRDAVPSSVWSGTQAQRKNNYINWVEGELSSGGRNGLGAAFIINTMVGAGSAGNPGRDRTPSASMLNDWRDRINNPNITINYVFGDPNTYGPSSSFSGKNNSGNRDTFFANYNSSPRGMVIFRNTATGGVVYVLEVPCANPVGGYRLPRASAATLDVERGSATATIRAGESYTFDLRIRAYDRTNVGSATFGWSFDYSDDGASTWTVQASGNREIAGSNPRVERTPTRTFNNPGTYCFRLGITSKPSWAEYADRRLRQCVNVTPAADLAAIGANIGNVDTGSTAVLNFKVEASNRRGVPDGAQFSWRVRDLSTNAIVIPIQNTAINGSNYRVNRDLTVGPYSTPDNRCFRIEILGPGTSSTTPSWVVRDPATAISCVNYVQQPLYKATNSLIDASGATVGSDYEKGGPLITVSHNINVTLPACDTTKGINNETWVNPRNWLSGPWSSPGPPVVTAIGGNGSGTVEFENCGDQVRVNGVVRPAGDTSYLTRYTPSTAAEINQLFNADPGQQFGRTTFVQGGAPDTDNVSFSVYEAPFARFFGNDVKVCGAGDANRFAYDNRTSSAYIGADAIDRRKGSFAEYASVFNSLNQPQDGAFPSVSYEGLQSAGVRTAWAFDYLLSNYSGLGLGACTVDANNIALDTTIATTSTISGNPIYSTPTTIYNNGDITISDISIQSTAPGSYDTATFDPDNFPIVLIYSTGDINIEASVNRIDAVLVAEGKINTCVQATGNNPSAISGACRNPLKINGAVVAQAVNLQRSGGTRYKADIGGAWNDNSGGVNIIKASEIIEYPWYLHFVNFESLTKDSDGGYKAYFSLPPRL